MSLLSKIVNQRPIPRDAALVITKFCRAAPLVLLVSGLVVYGVRSLFIERGLPPGYYRRRGNSARFLNSSSGVAFQAANAAHGKSSMRARHHQCDGQHRCHHSNQTHGPQRVAFHKIIPVPDYSLPTSAMAREPQDRLLMANFSLMHTTRRDGEACTKPASFRSPRAKKRASKV